MSKHAKCRLPYSTIVVVLLIYPCIVLTLRQYRHIRTAWIYVHLFSATSMCDDTVRVGWTAPSRVFGNTSEARQVLQRLQENLGFGDTKHNHKDFPDWQRNNTSSSPQVAQVLPSMSINLLWSSKCFRVGIFASVKFGQRWLILVHFRVKNEIVQKHPLDHGSLYCCSTCTPRVVLAHRCFAKPI